MSDAPTILAVEANPREWEAAIRLLRGARFHVLEAATGGDALRLAAGHPDLIVLDERLPDMSAADVLRRLREDPSTASTPVLLIAENGEEAPVAPGDARLAQPVEASLLLAKVEQLLGARAAPGATSDGEEDEAREQQFRDERAARVEAEAAKERLSFLMAASDLLASMADHRKALEALVELAVPRLADWCLVDVLTDRGVEQVAVAHVEPGKAELARELRRRFPPDWNGNHVLARVLHTGLSEVTPEVSNAELERIANRDPEALELLRALGVVSHMVVPLVVRGHTRGAVSLISGSSGRRYGPADLALAEELARRAAVAVETTSLLEAEQRARRVAESVAQRMARLQSVTAALSGSLTPQHVAGVILGEGLGALGARAGIVSIADPDGDLQILGATGYTAELLGRWDRLLATHRSSMNEAVATGRPVFLSSVEERLRRFPESADLQAAVGGEAVLAIPLQLEGRTLGALHFLFDEVREFTTDDTAFLEALARQCAQALDRARLYDSERSARAQAEAVREQLQFLDRASEVLVESLDYERTLARVSHLSVPAFADVAWVDLLEPHGSVRRLAVAHRDPRSADTASRLRELAPSPDGSGPVARALRTGESTLVSEVTEDVLRGDRDDEAYTEVAQRMGFRSMIVAGLVARGRRLGAISFVRTHWSRGPFTQVDVALAEDLASRCALGIDNAILFEAERHARAESEATGTRLTESLALLDALFATAPVGLALLDRDLRFVRLNERLAELSGRPPEAHVGRTVREAMPEIPAEVEHDLRVVLDTREPLEGREVAGVTSDPLGPRHWLVSYYPVLGPDREPLGVGAVIADITVRKRAEDRLSFLARASEILSSSLDYHETLSRLAELCVPTAADWAAVDVVGEDGEVEQLAVAHVDPAKVQFAYDLRERIPYDPDAEVGVANVLRTGRSEVIQEITEDMLESAVEDPELLRIIRELGLTSSMVVPLEARGRILGAITLISAESGRRFDDDDLAFAMELARRAALAVDNARLYRSERDARDASERAQLALAFLAEASTALTASLDFEATLHRLVEISVPFLADWAAVDVLHEDGEVRRIAVGHVDPDKADLPRQLVERWPPAKAYDHGFYKVIRSGEPELWEEVPDEVLAAAAVDEEHLAAMRGLGYRSYMCVPLAARGRTLGAITFVSASDRRFSETDLGLAQELARRASLAVDNARLYEERSYVARTLQQSLLPPALPEIPGVELAARYQAAGTGADVGGDFYDVFDTADGSWAIAMGDVCGKGPEAAAVTGLARHTIRAAAIRERRPSDILQTVNDALLTQSDQSLFCTIAYVRFHPTPEGARLTVACGGHPLPLVVRRDGTVEPAGRPGTLLGIFPEPELSDTVLDLAPGDAIVLYTDGVIEEHGPDGFGEDQLRQLLSTLAGATAPTIAEAIRATVVDQAQPPRDDIALLVLRVLP